MPFFQQPADEPEHACPACNPGMAVNAAGVCEFCQKGQWSDGNGEENNTKHYEMRRVSQVCVTSFTIISIPSCIWSISN